MKPAPFTFTVMSVVLRAEDRQRPAAVGVSAFQATTVTADSVRTEHSSHEGSSDQPVMCDPSPHFGRSGESCASFGSGRAYENAGVLRKRHRRARHSSRSHWPDLLDPGGCCVRKINRTRRRYCTLVHTDKWVDLPQAYRSRDMHEFAGSGAPEESMYVATLTPLCFGQAGHSRPLFNLADTRGSGHRRWTNLLVFGHPRHDLEHSQQRRDRRLRAVRLAERLPA